MIGINGLGRIGRIAARILAQRHPNLLGSLNDPADLETAIHLLRFDSVHGTDQPRVEGRRAGEQDFVRLVNREVPLFHVSDPAEVPWPASTRIVIEASGRFTRRAEAQRHLRDGIRHVVISAPSPDPDATLIAAIRRERLDHGCPPVVSNASCTAHATAPILDVLHRAFGVVHAGMSTVHVATNDQRLVDGAHTDLRRARAAFVGIHPTRSSAFQALQQTFNPAGARAADSPVPLAFDGLALRVPTLSVNLVDVQAVLARPVTRGDLDTAFREAACGRLEGILGIAEAPLVSCDFTGRSESVVMDLDLIQVAGPMVRVCGWHDNETAYAMRLCDLVVGIARRL